MNKKQKQGFTLIELLVVISIVGFMSVLAIVALSGTRIRARDAKRYHDIAMIKKALDLYHLENGEYPDETQVVGLFETSSEGDFMEYLNDYLAQAPVDPVNSATMQYYYSKNAWCGPSFGQGYILIVLDLELESGINPRNSAPKCGFYDGMASSNDYVVGSFE